MGIFKNKKRKEDNETLEVKTMEVEKALDTCHKGTTHKTFNTPYIEKLEPLSKFLKNPEEKLIELDILFDFILDMNVQEVIEK